MAEVIQLTTPLKSDAQALARTVISEFHRWGEVHLDVMKGDPAWIGLFADRTAHALETLVWKWSGIVIQFPQTSSFPNLRTLVLERAACHWASVILTNSASLRSFTLARVEPPNSLDIVSLWNGLRSSFDLEELQFDELSWSAPESEDYTDTIHLPKLRTISLTAVAHSDRLFRPFTLPVLTDIIVGDVAEDLSPMFRQLVEQTSTIESITTGLWDEPYASSSSSEQGLIALIRTQPQIRHLSLTEATVTDTLLLSITPSTHDDSPSAPGLETLELSGEGFHPYTLINMARARHDHLQTKTIEHLRLPPGLLSISETATLKQFVGEVEIGAGDWELEDT